MKKIVASIFCQLVLIGLTVAQTKILFLGNSFTYTYDVPGLFQGLANAAGIPVLIDQNTQAGMAVANEQVTGHINSSVSQNKITSQQWDYIVVQDNQGNYVNNVGVIPSACGNANVTLYNQIKANNPCTRIIYFAGWGPEGGVFSGDNTTSCINRIYGNTIFLNDAAMNEIVSPIGKAWISSLSQLPSVDLFHADNVHPSLAGSYLTAATLFVSIFKQNPCSLNYTGGVSSSTAQTMRNIAWTTVNNTTIFNETNLNTYTPVISQAGATLSTGSYSAYQWKLNGTVISGATSQNYTATSNGTYTVNVMNSSGCWFSSFPITMSTVSIKENEYNPDVEFLFNQQIKINGITEADVRVSDLNGKQLINQKIYNSDIIYLDFLASGIYIITITEGNNQKSIKFFKPLNP